MMRADGNVTLTSRPGTMAGGGSGPSKRPRASRTGENPGGSIVSTPFGGGTGNVFTRDRREPIFGLTEVDPRFRTRG